MLSNLQWLDKALIQQVTFSEKLSNLRRCPTYGTVQHEIFRCTIRHKLTVIIYISAPFVTLTLKHEGKNRGYNLTYRLNIKIYIYVSIVILFIYHILYDFSTIEYITNSITEFNWTSMHIYYIYLINFNKWDKKLKMQLNISYKN